MSVLSFPRIYFTGTMQWSPNTANNNDYVPTYDAADAQLNFGYLGEQNPPITPQNAPQSFPPWVIQSVADACPQQTGGPSDNCNSASQPSSHMASRWNYYGGNDCAFWQYENPNTNQSYNTNTVGGVLLNGSPASAADPIVNQPLALLGTGGQPARMVDINPGSPFCTQIFFATLTVGGGAASIVTAAPPSGQPLPVMYTRSFFVPRNYSSELIIAGAIGVVFQATVPAASVEILAGGSDLLASFQQALNAPGAQGLMLRFAAYTTLYYQNGTYNDIPYKPRSCAELVALYEQVQQGKIKPFVNPAYSTITGAIGIWKQGELQTAPGGHLLVPNAQLTPLSAGSDRVVRRTAGPLRVVGHAAVQLDAAAGGDTGAAAQGPPLVNLGLIQAELNPHAPTPIISLDLMNAFPESDVNGTKWDLGPFTLGVLMDANPTDYAPVSPGATFSPIGSFDYNQYALPSYLASGGILDVPFAPGVALADVERLLAAGGLALQAQGSQIAAVEMPLTVDTDDRGVYVDEGQTQTITLQVRYLGGLPPAGTQVLVAQYYPSPLTLGSGALELLQPPFGGSNVCTQAPEGPYVSLPGTPLTVDANGIATLTISPVGPGFPVLAFYPYLASWAQPAPQSQITFGFAPFGTFAICTAFFATVRVLGFDDDLICEFVEQWNSGSPPYSSDLAWSFVYDNIFMTYDLIYPVMQQFVNLGNQQDVQANIKYILAAIAAPGVTGSTQYMPITRELSAGARLVLQSWGGLVEAGFPQQLLPPPPNCGQAASAGAQGRGRRAARNSP